MSYKDVDFSQDVVNEQKFLQLVKDLPEKFFADKKQRGRFGDIHVLMRGVFSESYFVKTTVSDVLDVCKGINITWITEKEMHDENGMWIRLLCNLSVAKPKQYRGKLKFVPRNTLSLKVWVVGTDDNGKSSVKPIGDFPMLQDEAFVKSSVDNAYNNDDEGVDYDYIMNHAFRMLYNDKRFIGDKGLYKNLPSAREEEFSYITHEMICRYYEVKESWAICYDFNENLFIFPMRQEFLKETLNGRDKIDGRKRVLPTVVKKHNRRNRPVSSHLRSYNGDIVMGGRSFEILVGADSFPQIFPDNNYGMKKMGEIKRKLDEMRAAGEID